jgi:flagellar hook-basal body complex protein FliE
MAIEGITSGIAGAVASPAQAARSEAASFVEAIGQAVEHANQAQVEAHRAVADLAVRGEGTLHDVMIALEAAEGSFRLLMEMRNRLIDGVNRLLQTQV